MNKESHLELKVGLFVLLAMVSLTVFIWSISDTSSFEKGKQIKVIFGFASGLKKNAPVRIAGVDEGIVKNINLFFDRTDGRTKAEVEIWIGKDTKIPKDSFVTINQLGLLGEKYVEIVPGVDTKEFFKEGDAVIGKDPVAQTEISERILEVADSAEEIITGLSRVINDERNIDRISSTLANLTDVSGGLKAIIEDMRQGKGTVGRLLYDETLYDELQGFTSDLRQNPWKLFYRPKNLK